MTRAFVVQEHRLGPADVHWDLMVEAGPEQPLVTFQLRAPPLAAVAGRRTPDHRRAYLDYEGPVSGERGVVAIWDRGQVEDEQGDPRAPRWRGRFAGVRLRGPWELQDGPAGEVALRPGGGA